MDNAENTHTATVKIFETSPGGILGEHYFCSCGSASTAAQMAGSAGGQIYSGLFGHNPCAAIRALHNGDEDTVTIDV